MIMKYLLFLALLVLSFGFTTVFAQTNEPTFLFTTSARDRLLVHTIRVKE